MSEDLKGNTNFVFLKNLQDELIVPRTNLAAVDMTAANGLSVDGSTIYINRATAEDIALGTSGSVVTPDVLKPILDAKQASIIAGTGISISDNTVSTADIPQSAVTGLSVSLAAKQDNMTAGYRNEIISGTTIAQKRYFDIDSSGMTGTTGTITLEAGSAYKILATTGSKTLNTETVPANQFGLEGHAEIFVAGTGLIKTGANVVLAQPLEPDSVNNCTVRFHDGRAIISIEDHIAGHVVKSAGSGTDSLKYWLETANTSDQATQYISVDAGLNNTVLDFANAAVNGEKHLVGNGYTATTVSGSVDCGVNKFTVSNLGLQNVQVTGGTLTLGDAFIPSGSTVEINVENTGLFIEKVAGNGDTSVIDGLNKGKIYGLNYLVSDVTITRCKRIDGSGIGIFKIYGDVALITNTTAHFTNVNFVSNGIGTPNTGGTLYVHDGGICNLTNCSFSDNHYTAVAITNGSAFISGCSFGEGQRIRTVNTGSCTFIGSNATLSEVSGTSTGKVYISSGAIVDLTGNSNVTPIAPGGGIVIGSNVQIYPSAGSASAVEISGGTYKAITNAGVMTGGRVGANETADGHATATVSLDGIFVLLSNSTLKSFKFTDAGGFYISVNTATIADCTLACPVRFSSSGTLTLSGDNKITNRLYATSGTSGTVSLTSGAILDLTGNENETPIAPGGDIVFEAGGATVKVGDAAASSSYMMDNVALPTGAKLTNTAVVDLNSSFITATGSCSFSGCFLSGGSGTKGGAIVCESNAIVSMTDCEIAGSTASAAGSVIAITENRPAIATLTNCYCHNNSASTGPTVYAEAGKITLNNCIFSGNTGGGMTYISDATAWGGGVIVINGGTFGTTRVSNNGSLEFAGNVTLKNVNGSGFVTISSGAFINLTTYINPGGTGGITVLTGGCTVNGNVIPAGTYTSINSNGQPT